MHISFHFIVVYLAAVCLGFFLHFNSYLLSRCLLLPFPFPALMNAHCTPCTHCSVCVSVCATVLFLCPLHHALVYYVIMLEFSAGSASFLLLLALSTFPAIFGLFSGVYCLLLLLSVRLPVYFSVCLSVRLSVCDW